MIVIAVTSVFKTGSPDAYFDTSLGHASLQSAVCVKVRPEPLRGGEGADFFLPAKMSGIPWPALEALYRAFWMILAAALGLSREVVKCVSGERIVGSKLYSAAWYQLSAEDAVKLGEPDVRRRLEVSIALLEEKYLWVPTELGSLYPSLPWGEMLQSCQLARDEIKGKNLPCQVTVEVQAANISLTFGPTLAPRRPANVQENRVTEVGHSNGFRYRYDHKLFFSKDDGRPPVEITYEEQKMLEKVIEASRVNAPWIEVEYIEERHDGVVVSRLLKCLEIKNDSLLDATQT